MRQQGTEPLNTGDEHQSKLSVKLLKLRHLLGRPSIYLTCVTCPNVTRYVGGLRHLSQNVSSRLRTHDEQALVCQVNSRRDGAPQSFGVLAVVDVRGDELCVYWPQRF